MIANMANNVFFVLRNHVCSWVRNAFIHSKKKRRSCRLLVVTLKNIPAMNLSEYDCRMETNFKNIRVPLHTQSYI